jgi:hypothetical protein
MKALFEAIQARLKDRVKPYKWGKTFGVHLYNGQVENPQDANPFSYPAAFIEFQNIDFGDIQNYAQEVQVDIVLRVVFQTYKTDPLHVFEVKQAVYLALMGFVPLEGWTPLTRTNEITDDSYTSVYAYMLTFTTGGYDFDALNVSDASLNNGDADKLMPNITLED